MQLHKIYNHVPLSSYALRIGNVVDINGMPHVINALAGRAVEAIPVDGLIYSVFSIEEVRGHVLIKGYGDEIPKRLLVENGFIAESEIMYSKALNDGSSISIRINYLTDRWEVSHNGHTRFVYYVHEFQNDYYFFTEDQLKSIS